MCLIAAADILSTLEPYWYYVQVAIGLGFVIFVHELGHFAVAKFCGVKCEKFYVGFDVPMPKIGPFQIPSTLGKFRLGETEYGIGIIPLGGYVKMLGQDDNPMKAEEEAQRIRVQSGDDDPESPTDEAAMDPRQQALADGTSAEGLESGTSVERESARVELDPRSYPAKSVPQRMAIISAGVIMNLIFGIIFAMVAYLAGVRYTPCEIGSTSAGDPAWEIGLDAGETIVQLHKGGDPREHLRFDHDLRSRVLHAGLHETPKPIDLLIRSEDGSTRWVVLTPTAKLRELTPATTIGVSPRQKTVIASVNKYLAAGEASEPLQPGDRIVAVDGQPLTVDADTGDIYVDELERLLIAKLNQPVTLSIERTTEEEDASGGPIVKRFDTTVAAAPVRTVGLQMEIGPIVAIRKGSPAVSAGFQVGDVIRSINGRPIQDPMLLPYDFAGLIGQEVTFEVYRSGVDSPPVTETVGAATATFMGQLGAAATKPEELIQIKVTPTGDFRLSEAMGLGAFVALENVGIAYRVSLRVANVVPGSPAAKAGMQRGDKLTKLEVVAETAAEKKLAVDLFGKEYAEPQELSNNIYNWPLVYAGFQGTPEEVRWQLTYRRGDEEKQAIVSSVDAIAAGDADEPRQYYALDRGIAFKSVSRVHTAATIKEAAYLGCRESLERGSEILSVLHKLFTGRLSIRNLGGPLRIFEGASREASQGWPRLLMFLTFLSVNLAILNFLPVPALDGGHMVFLLYEGVTRKPPNEKVQTILTLVGVGLLLCLMIFVFTNDILTMFFS